jgi:hypothetical protein
MIPAEDGLGEIRRLSEVLRLGTTVTSAEHDSKQATACILAIFSLAESLNTDLRYSGQSMRRMLCLIAFNSLNTAMNNIAFSDAEMQRLQESIERLLHDWPQRYTLDIQLHSEAIELMEAMDSPLHLQNHYGGHKRADSEKYYQERIFANFLSDIQACERVGALALVQAESHFLDWSQTTRRTGHIDLRELPAPTLPEDTDSHRERYGTSFREPEPSRLFDAAFFCIYRMDSRCRVDCLDRTNLSLISVALGVERFRLATGHLPERLDELLPRFLDSIPEDPWGSGHSVLYCAEADGSFAVFTFGWEDRNKAPGGLSGARFEVRNPEFRNRPPIAPADSSANASKTSS